MGKASRTKEPDRRARIAAQRAAAKRAEQRKRIYIAGGSILAVIIVVLAFVIIKANTKSSSSSSASTAGTGITGPTGTALTSLIKVTTSVPAATLDAVGTGSGEVSGKPVTIKPAQSALSANGKPEMLYMGAEYCPFCAAERWAMVVALSRFGTFTGLETTHSAITDGGGNQEVDPNTPTWTFLRANYTSKYLTFDHVELNTNIPDASTGGYTALQTPNTVQNALIDKYDTSTYYPGLSEAGSIPFIDFGNKYLVIGASYDPAVLAGKTWAQVAAALTDTSSSIAQAVDGTANYISAAICAITNNQPATACTATVQALEKQI
jgi:thiol-disulfide isomerase/thioredoxin